MSDIPDDITLVHSLIERHLRQYKTKSETVAAVSAILNINPEFIERMWEQLERENSEFFRAYNFCMMLVSQINRFNELLEQQAVLMFEQEPGILSESVSSSGSPLSSEESVNFWGDCQESSTGSTTTPRTDANAQNWGEIPVNGGGEITLEAFLRHWQERRQ